VNAELFEILNKLKLLSGTMKILRYKHKSILQQFLIIKGVLIYKAWKSACDALKCVEAKT
jgi:hypothetical protein